MKKLLFFFLLLPSLAFSQTPSIKGLGKVVIAGSSGGGTTVPVDTSKEAIQFTFPVTNVYYSAIRPNQVITVTGDFTFYENWVPIGASGQVTFVITGTAVIQVNGVVSNAFPTSGTFTRTYTNVAGVLTWT